MSTKYLNSFNIHINPILMALMMIFTLKHNYICQINYIVTRTCPTTSVLLNNASFRHTFFPTKKREREKKKIKGFDKDLLMLTL